MQGASTAQFWIQVLTGLVGLNVVSLLVIAWRGGHTLGVIKTTLEHMGRHDIANKHDVDEAHDRIRALEQRLSRCEFMLDIDPRTGNIASRTRTNAVDG